MYIYSHNPVSEGAKALKDKMGIKRIKHENSNFKGGPNKVVINWGSSKLPLEVQKSKVINPAAKVALCTNKLDFFKFLEKEEVTPDFTTSFEKAVEWCGAGMTVCARTILNGHSGAGIVLMSKKEPDKFVKAPLYVRYIPKDEEYRFHVVHGKVIDMQRKTAVKEKVEAGQIVEWRIRNLDNGFIYQKLNVNPPKEAIDLAIKVVKLIGLDFGAVDLVVGRFDKKPYVLEINTAPGLQGTTIDNYAEALK